MKVTFFHRRPRPNYNFSVENLFKQIRESLPSEVEWEVRELSYYSEGIFKRFLMGVEAALGQKGINHVTGDINFIAIFLRKRRTVLTILDVGFMNHPNRLARWLLKWFWIILPVRSATVITTISNATKREVLRYVNIDPDRIRVVYVPILPSFQPFPKTFNKACPVILQIGTKPNKNISRLAEALFGIECFLEIVGDLGPDLESKLTHYGIHYRASVNLSNQEVLEKYRAADVVSFVSTYEGFGMPIVEANSVGRVVVTSNLLSMPEVAGGAAQLVDPFDVLSIRNGFLKVLGDDYHRDELIKRGFVNCHRFDAKEIAGQFVEIYRTLA